MLLDSLTFDHKGVVDIEVRRTREDNYSSEFRGESGDYKFDFTVKHTIPARGQPGESHLMRLDVEKYDSVGAYVGTHSAWVVARSSDTTQDLQEANDAYDALLSILKPAHVTKILNRES